jgi:hypothetical protein
LLVSGCGTTNITEVYYESVTNMQNETTYSSEFLITVSGLDMVAAHLTFSHPVTTDTVVILDAVRYILV